MGVFVIQFCECGAYLYPTNDKLICRNCGFEKDSSTDLLGSYTIKKAYKC
ncbi:MAG: hypothetical protein ACXVHS_03460 [Methanobacterium sp.]